MSEELDLVKREKRRMDELITIKEDQVDKLQEALKQANGKLVMYEEELLKCKNMEDKLRHWEKKYKRDVHSLQNELMLYKRSQCETQASSHNSNGDSQQYKGSSATTCATNSNQYFEKPR